MDNELDQSKQEQQSDNNHSSDNEINSESKEQNNKNDQDSEGKQKFKEGQSLSLIRVRFPGNSRSFPFLYGKRKLQYGQKVVAMSDRGMAVGYVNSFPYQIKYQANMGEIRYINKVATQEDLDNQKQTYKREKQVETLCKNLIEKHKLGMNLTHVEFTQFGKKVVFYFNAPARVDFRALVKELVHELKLRVELRQITVRDRSASVGGIGPCGRQLCCSSFLSKYGNVNVKLAKNQNLTLNYSKLNGVCGQLKCCLQYEDEVYEHKRKKLPKEKELIATKNGDRGKVIRLHLLSEQFDMLTEKGSIKRFTVDQVKEKLKKDFRMPEKFEHISDETATVIGLNEYQSQKGQDFEKEVERLKSKAPEYADKIYQEVFANSYFRESKETNS